MKVSTSVDGPHEMLWRAVVCPVLAYGDDDKPHGFAGFVVFKKKDSKFLIWH